MAMASALLSESFDCESDALCSMSFMMFHSLWFGVANYPKLTRKTQAGMAL